MASDPMGFHEGPYRVTWIPDASEMQAIHQLRADVFCRELRWVGSRSHPLEHDEFDGAAAHIAVVDPGGEVAATLRLIPGDARWMLDEVFQDLVAGRAILRKSDAAEASRLAVAKRARGGGSRLDNGRRLADLVYKAAFVFCTVHRIRYVYMVVSETVLRHMSAAGLPCVPIAPPTEMPDGVSAVPVVLDWQRLVNGPIRAWYEEGVRAVSARRTSPRETVSIARRSAGRVAEISGRRA